ncbi:MAG: aminotransferase class V-fold PLP-dependent enzyme, partial [Vicinamibacteria bacterium]
FLDYEDAEFQETMARFREGRIARVHKIVSNLAEVGVNISVDRVEAESLLIALDLEGVAVSSGSACSSGTLEPSHVLKAMGLPHHRTLNSLRFSLGAGTTEAEIDRVLAVLPALVEKLRSLSAVAYR